MMLRPGPDAEFFESARSERGLRGPGLGSPIVAACGHALRPALPRSVPAVGGAGRFSRRAGRSREGCALLAAARPIGAGGAVFGLWVEQEGLRCEAADLGVDCAEEGADLAAGQALDGPAELGHRRVL